VHFPLEIFLSERPAPVVQNTFADRAEHFQLGTLSHLLNQKCFGYTELPDFPAEQPDPTIRRSACPLPSDSPKGKPAKNEEEEEEEEEDDEEEEEEEFTSDEAEEGSGEEEEEDESEEEEEEETPDEAGDGKQTKPNLSVESAGGKRPSTSSSSSSSSTAASEPKKPAQVFLLTIIFIKNILKKIIRPRIAEGRKADLMLLDLDFGPSMLASSSSALPTAFGPLSKWSRVPAQWVPEEFPVCVQPFANIPSLPINLSSICSLPLCPAVSPWRVASVARPASSPARWSASNCNSSSAIPNFASATSSSAPTCL
jgi:hypothetical protein